MGAKNLAKLPTHAEVRSILENGLRTRRVFDARKLPSEELKIYREVLGQMVKERLGSPAELDAITEYTLLTRIDG